MVKHTPGPWSYGRLDHKVILVKDDFAIKAFNGSAHGTVAYLYDQNWSGAGGQIDIANARLIAAAPDLLEACKSVETWLEECPPTELIKGVDVWAPILREAIAKAEGNEDA